MNEKTVFHLNLETIYNFHRTQSCNEFTCACNEGYEGDGTKDYCTKICDEDQCAAEENPCGDFSICTNECEGFTCECEEGFEDASEDDVTDCRRICEDGYENVDNECLIICEEGFIRTEENTCFKVPPETANIFF